MHRNTDGYKREYKKRGELWMHDGKKETPHPILNSGKHADSVFKLKIFDDFFSEAIGDLVVLLGKKVSLIDIDRVVGPETNATRMAQFLSFRIGNEPGRQRLCHWSSPKKQGEGKDKKLIFRESKQFTGDNVLICDNVLTTGESIELTAKATEAKGGIVLSFVLVVVNWSGLKRANGRRIISLMNLQMSTWEPGKCQLCELGSPAIRPSEGNWSCLTAKY